MTEQEAVRRIKNHNEIHSRKEPFNAIHIAEALEMAIEALEKQIPKKPIFESEQTSLFGVDDVPYCPSCRCELPEVSYCEKCGQALDWSERYGGEENG